MTKKLDEVKELKIERPERARLSEEESLKRMQELPRRKEKLIATVREGTD